MSEPELNSSCAQVGYGDITPVTLGEICYATFVIIQGGFMLGYVKMDALACAFYYDPR